MAKKNKKNKFTTKRSKKKTDYSLTMAYLAKKAAKQFGLKDLTPELKIGLLKCLTDPIGEFEKLGAVTPSKDGPAILIDNDADILAVGHLDWVYFNDNPKIDWKRGIISKTPQLDDRLGVWVLLYLLPVIAPDLKYDVLLCDSEEIGRSTGQNWEFGQKQYNWGFEFDRAGTDTVLYEYDSPAWRKTVGEFSPIGRGAFSDISYLENLCCKMMNIGCGYHDQHTKHCYAKLEETIMMTRAFAVWASENKDTLHTHTEYVPPLMRHSLSHSAYDYGYNDEPETWQDYVRSEFDDVECKICKSLTDQELICADCQYAAARMYA